MFWGQGGKKGGQQLYVVGCRKLCDIYSELDLYSSGHLNHFCPPRGHIGGCLIMFRSAGTATSASLKSVCLYASPDICSFQ